MSNLIYHQAALITKYEPNSPNRYHLFYCSKHLMKNGISSIDKIALCLEPGYTSGSRKIHLLYMTEHECEPPEIAG
jgi:hypothetical protein